jgi:dTDP-4-amino-4,6-dideoxygalactose transaminase
MVVARNPALAAVLREMREYGWRERYVSACVGINSRLDSVQAAILRVKLGSLEADNARRRTIADRYDSGLAKLPLTLPKRRSYATHVFHQYVIRLADRDALRDWLQAAGIRTGIHYPVPVHLQPAYRGRLAAGPSGLGVTERASRQILSLPMYPQISEEMIQRIITQIQGFFSRLR